jgi:hypothetical protein
LQRDFRLRLWLGLGGGCGHSISLLLIESCR